MEIEHLDLGYGEEEVFTKKRLVAEFFKDAVINEAKTAANVKPDGSPGAPIYDTKVFVRVVHPGRLEAPVFEATEKYRKQFPQEWKRFIAEDTTENGIPLSKITTLGLDMVKSLTAQGVRYAEQLAALSDDDLANFGLGARDARNKAQVFLGQFSEVELLKKRILELEKNGKNDSGDSKKRNIVSGI